MIVLNVLSVNKKKKLQIFVTKRCFFPPQYSFSYLCILKVVRLDLLNL